MTHFGESVNRWGCTGGHSHAEFNSLLALTAISVANRIGITWVRFIKVRQAIKRLAATHILVGGRKAHATSTADHFVTVEYISEPSGATAIVRMGWTDNLAVSFLLHYTDACTAVRLFTNRTVERPSESCACRSAARTAPHTTSQRRPEPTETDTHKRTTIHRRVDAVAPSGRAARTVTDGYRQTGETLVEERPSQTSGRNTS